MNLRPEPNPVALRSRAAALLVSLVIAGPVQATDIHPTPGPAELEAFFDAVFAQEIARFGVRGGVVTVVRSGQTVLKKGYGVADDGGAAVSPDLTLFRVGSVSKVITAMAVLQQVERGRLDLGRDVNEYPLGFRVPAPWGRITLHHLLLHTAGFDEHHIGFFPREPARRPGLGADLARRLGRPFAPPGQYFVYSNVGMDLAGYLVELASGMEFEQYARRHVLDPLGMADSTFAPRPYPGNGVATGYYHRKGGRSAVPMPYLIDTPAAGLKATGTDMARLVAALLSGQPEGTIGQMRQRRFGYHPLLDGATYGLREHLENGQRALVHPGLMPGFVCLVCVLPEHQLGFFVACNNSHPQQTFNATVLGEFFARFFPVGRPPDPRGGAEPAAALARFAGDYRPVNFAHDSFEKLASLLQHVRVRVARDGVLRIRDEEWTQAGPDLFYRDGQYAHFIREAGGRVTHLAIGPGALELLPAYETLPWQLGMAAGFVLVFLSECLVWPAWSLVRRLRSATAPPLPPAAAGMGFLAASPNLGFLGGIIVTLAQSDYYDFLYGMPNRVVALLCITLVTSGLAVALATLCVRCWMDRAGSLAGRLYLSAVAVTGVAFIPFLDYWNLLGFRY